MVFEEEASRFARLLRATPLRRLGFTLSGLALLTVGALGAFGALTVSVSVIPLVILVVVALAGWNLARLGVQGRPLLEWTDDGLIDRTSILGSDLLIPWGDIDAITTSRIHSGVRVELKEHPECFEGLGIGRRIQRMISRLRGFRGIEISPSFMRLDYRALGRVLDELTIQNQVREIREEGGIVPDEVALGPYTPGPENP